MTKKDARAFRARWKLVKDIEREETRRTSFEVKYRQFLALLQWTRAFGWEKELARGEGQVRKRWIKLRKAYRAKKANGDAAT